LFQKWNNFVYKLKVLENYSISIIGSGNLAANLAFAFKKAGVEVHVNGRNQAALNYINERYGIEVSVGYENLHDSSAIYIISITDDSIEELVQNTVLKKKIDNRLVIHTSGSVTCDVLSRLSSNYGVFYPLQTFTKEIPSDFSHIPICIEANTGFNQDLLIKFALKISDLVKRISTKERQYIHLAAVFANNFSNRMMAIAEEILKEHNLDFSILLPLIEESAKKIKQNSPGKIQTGPASRNDLKTIELHLRLLGSKIDLRDIYQLITNNIINNNMK
jgi:predicted short-subunit dehydrogenase-like oxidoreductase (DUF2520 family)